MLASYSDVYCHSQRGLSEVWRTPPQFKRNIVIFSDLSSISSCESSFAYYVFSLFFTGTHDIHALILGRAITGLQSFTVDK